MLTTAFTVVMSGQFFEKVIAACSVGAQSCLIPGSIHRRGHSGSQRMPVELIKASDQTLALARSVWLRQTTGSVQTLSQQ